MSNQRVLSVCTHEDYTRSDTRCTGKVFMDGTVSGGCGKADCRFMKKKLGEGYPPLPGPQEQELLRILSNSVVILDKSEREAAFQNETGFVPPSKPDDKYSEQLRKRAFDHWLINKTRIIKDALNEYGPQR